MNLIRERGKNAGNVMLFIVLVAGYLFFMTSKLWLPDMKEFINATPYFEKQIFDNYNIYLTKWEYAESQQKMEVIVEIETTDLLAAPLECEAVERTKGALHTEIALKNREFFVIQILDVPENWKEISLHLKNEEGDYMGMYTNVDAIKRVERIEKKDAAGYEVERIQGQIEYDAYQIRLKQDEISRLTAENRKLKSGIEKMKANQYPTQKEADDAAALITTAEEKCTSNENTLEKIKKEIEELETRTEGLQKQLEELK